MRVRLPILPNGSTGWVPRGALGSYHKIWTHLVIDRRLFSATLYRRGVAVFRTRVGVGKSYWPTPAGQFYVRERITGFSDPIYGPIVNDHIRAACREAVVFVYGALDFTPLTLELGGMLRKQIRLQGYTIGPLLGDPERRARAIAGVAQHLERGDFSPVIDSYFPLDRVADAHRRLESNLQVGKVVVTP